MGKPWSCMQQISMWQQLHTVEKNNIFCITNHTKVVSVLQVMHTASERALINLLPPWYQAISGIKKVIYLSRSQTNDRGL